MGQLLNNPSSVPVSVAADWETLLNVNAAGNVGFNAITLTNWDAGTLAPAIAAGSMIEINGSIAYFQNQEAITGGQAGALCYLWFTVTGTTVSASWDITAPAWNPAKNGWYSGISRSSGHRTTLEGTAYYYKNKMKDGPGGLVNMPDCASMAGRYLTYTYPAHGNFLPPAGGYIFARSGNIIFKVWDGSVWVPSSGAGELEFSGGFFVVDGVNFNFYGLNTSVLHYRRLW